MSNTKIKSVWHDIYPDDPVKRVTMELRSQLMQDVVQKVRSWKVTQAEAGKRLAIQQPRVSALMGGRMSEFNLEALVELAARAGLSPTLSTQAAPRPRARASAEAEAVA